MGGIPTGTVGSECWISYSIIEYSFLLIILPSPSRLHFLELRELALVVQAKSDSFLATATGFAISLSGLTKAFIAENKTTYGWFPLGSQSWIQARFKVD